MLPVKFQVLRHFCYGEEFGLGIFIAPVAILVMRPRQFIIFFPLPKDASHNV